MEATHPIPPECLEWRRFRALYLKRRGWVQRDIAEALDVSEVALRGEAWGQTEFQVNLKLGLTPRRGETRSDPAEGTAPPSQPCCSPASERLSVPSQEPPGR
jgi:hypothetical protein